MTITAKSKTAAQTQARKILVEVGEVTIGTSATMNQLLAEWMRFQTGRGRSPTTLYGYQSLIDHHTNDALGNVKIGDLTAH